MSRMSTTATLIFELGRLTDLARATPEPQAALLDDTNSEDGMRNHGERIAFIGAGLEHS